MVKKIKGGNILVDCKKLVVKHNKLIEAQGRMTALEQKFVLGVVAQIKPQDEDFKDYEITIDEMVNVFGINKKNVYRVVEETTKSIQRRVIHIREDKRNLICSFFSSADYIEGEGTVKFSFDPKLKPYLIQLGKNFTKYELDNIVNIPSSHAIRIYELLKQYQTIGHRTLETEELRKCLGLENEYSRFYDFERFVLKVSEKEINKHTDLKISYKKIKRGRKIAKINFKIEHSQSAKDKEYQDAKELCEIIDFNTKKLANNSGLQGFKINDKQFMDIYEIACRMTDIAELDPCKYIKINYEYMLTKQDIVSPVAYLKSILEIDGADARIKMLSDKYGL